MRVWSTQTGTLITSLVGHLTFVRAASFSPDGRWIVTAGTDGTARVWEFPSGVQRASLLGHNAAVTSASFDPSGAFTVVTSSDDGTARTWDAAVNPRMRLFSQLAGGVNGLAYSPDGKLLASAGADGALRMWNVMHRQLARTILSDTPSTAWPSAAAVDSSRPPARGWQAFGAWPGASRSHHLTQPGVVHAVAFSPDGTRLATAGEDGIARIRPLSGGPSVELHHPAAVEDIAFSPDGSLIATACADGAIRLWTRGACW